MKIQIFLLVLLSLLVSCTDTQEQKMSFTIPEEIIEVDNSGDITVNGEAVTLSGEKLEV